MATGSGRAGPSSGGSARVWLLLSGLVLSGLSIPTGVIASDPGRPDPARDEIASTIFLDRGHRATIDGSNGSATLEWADSEVVDLLHIFTPRAGRVG